MGKHVVEKYTNTLLSTAIPVMMSLGVLIFLLGVLDIAWGRFCRIQRRLSCSVYRRGRASRTEHFRRKRRSDCVRGKEEDAPCRPEGMDFIKIYFRTVLAVFIDRTEMETEEIEKKLFSQRQGQIRRRRRISSTRRRRSSHRRRRCSCNSRRSSSDNSWQAMAMARLGRKLHPRRSASAPCSGTGRRRHRDNVYSGAVTEAKLGHNASGVLATTGHTTTPSYL